MRVISPVVLSLSLALTAAVSVEAQAPPGPPGVPAPGQKPPPPKPTPRWPDGRVKLTGSPDDVGNWEGPANATLYFDYKDGKKVAPQASLPTNKTVNEIPFKPGFKEQYLSRESQADDPHTRCKPSGGSRFWHTPYGVEILDLPETHEVIFLGVGAPHSWRNVYMDGRPHPKDLKPSWYGHSIGKWEGDTLVVDTVGFNERFWLTREGVPHTSQLHLIEKFSRPNHDQLRYEATVDDPGAYTATWSGGWFLRWSPGNEPFDYLCQENNRDPGRMILGK
jgi:hypothetical protein